MSQYNSHMLSLPVAAASKSVCLTATSELPASFAWLQACKWLDCFAKTVRACERVNAKDELKFPMAELMADMPFEAVRFCAPETDELICMYYVSESARCVAFLTEHCKLIVRQDADAVVTDAALSSAQHAALLLFKSVMALNDVTCDDMPEFNALDFCKAARQNARCARPKRDSDDEPVPSSPMKRHQTVKFEAKADAITTPREYLIKEVAAFLLAMPADCVWSLITLFCPTSVSAFSFIDAASMIEALRLPAALPQPVKTGLHKLVYWLLSTDEDSALKFRSYFHLLQRVATLSAAKAT